ncbi:MAG: serine protease [Planctomycetota bacterium]|nr:serine protease [Planctomycetota bacterium]
MAPIIRIFVQILLVVMAICLLSGCTTVVNLKYTGTDMRLASWANSVGAVEVDPYSAEFFHSGGMAIVDTPKLSPNAHRELADAIKDAIRRRGGATDVHGAPTLKIQVQQCTLSWESGGAGIKSEAEVFLKAELQDSAYGNRAFSGHGVARQGAMGVVLASSAQPLVTRANSLAIDELLNAPETPKVSGNPPSLPPASKAGSGSGFFVSASGHVATAAHVISGASKVWVLYTGKKLEAQIIAQSRSLDLAILKIEAKPSIWLPITAQGGENLGDAIFTIGFPVPDLIGAQPVYNDGSISAIAGIDGDTSFLQVSIPIQPGNSGGPVVLSDGRVVGVVSFMAAIGPFLRRTGTLPQNVNWAVRSSLLKTLPNWRAGDDIPAPTTDRKIAVDRVKQSVVQILTE